MDPQQQKWICDAQDLVARAAEKKIVMVIACREDSFDEIVISNATSPDAISAMLGKYHGREVEGGKKDKDEAYG